MSKIKNVTLFSLKFLCVSLKLFMEIGILPTNESGHPVFGVLIGGATRSCEHVLKGSEEVGAVLFICNCKFLQVLGDSLLDVETRG